MYSAAIHSHVWKRFDREPVNFDGVDCCVYVDEFGEGEISVELIPEDEDESACWPVDVLRLPKTKQQLILAQLK